MHKRALFSLVESFAFLPLFAMACVAEQPREAEQGEASDALEPSQVVWKKHLEPVAKDAKRPSDPPPITCENVLCAPNTVCTMDTCDGGPACVPPVCGTIAGITCPEGFACKLEGDYPDAAGKCVADCEPTCGKCISDEDCGDGYLCTAGEECLSWCECPLCDVCAGHCKAKPAVSSSDTAN